MRLLAKVRRRSDSSSLRSLAQLLDGSPLPVHQDHWDPWRLMASRGPPSHSVPPYQSIIALKGTLKDTIHGFYLKALSRLPASRRAALPLPPQFA
ncbi:hypothetical protein GUJ93_ZPchr0009g803 [Zizania palustris]|uniref:Uncharacterized protein n=1 Tax=Zizania palustris TaxID=103762 RepID=A0A8J5RMH7_ZIZPA|nr:hypothetical protein GUJ93_ZPchr0009g803 [Zizania palustris]